MGTIYSKKNENGNKVTNIIAISAIAIGAMTTLSWALLTFVVKAKQVSKSVLYQGILALLAGLYLFIFGA